MTRLILLNGPPGAGKSTIAARYAEDHPLTLNLDIDRIRDLLGRWPDDPHNAGLLARAIALAAARTHLTAGHDVVIPQLVARPEFLQQLEHLATETGAELHEIVLLTDKQTALHRRGGVAATLYDRLIAILPTRPAARVIHTRDVDQTYHELLARLA